MSKNKVSIEKLKTKSYNLVEELILQDNNSQLFERILYNYKTTSKPKAFNNLLNSKNTYMVSFNKPVSGDNKKATSNVEKTVFAKFVEKIKGSKRTFTVERVKLSNKYKKELSLLDIAVLKGDSKLVSKILMNNPNYNTIASSKTFTENKGILELLNNKLQNLEFKKNPKRNMSLRRMLLLDNVAKMESQIHKNKGKLRDTCKLYSYYPNSLSVQRRLNDLLGYKKTKQFNIKEFCNNLEKLIKKVD